jgi:hypothetical protein
MLVLSNTGNRSAKFEIFSLTDIEQVLREKNPFIIRCLLDGIKKLQGRMGKWTRCVLSVSITEACWLLCSRREGSLL